jgi:glucokinase
MLSIGVDLGGTNLRAAVVDTTTGRVLTDAHRPTRAEGGPPIVIERMAALIEESGLARYEITAIGIGVPGVYDPATNVVRFLPNLPTSWLNVPLGREIESRVGRPTMLINDARAFVLAEAAFGAGQGADTVVGMTLGTGIGGGVVIAGRLRLGLDGTAGEVGHQIIDFNGPICGCGSRGCLEAYASGPAITTLGIKAVRQGRTTAIRDLVAGDLNRITPEIIVQAAEVGDAVAREILDEVGFYLGIGIANLVTLFSPDMVVIGGGVSRAGDWLLQPIRATVRQRCHMTPVDRVRIVLAALGEEAGVIGAALWASQTAYDYRRTI